jgi:hypothetical protein
MKTKLIVLVVAATLEPLAQAHATVLRDACGDDKVKFDVKTQKDHPAPVPPEAGKAQLVLIENNDRQVSPFRYATTRFGTDDAWVGADNGNSNFVLTVAPGEHQLGASGQSSVGRAKQKDVGSFTPEAGRVFYFAANKTMTGGSGAGMVPPTRGPNRTMTGGRHGAGSDPRYIFQSCPTNPERGKYRVKAWKSSTSKPSE